MSYWSINGRAGDLLAVDDRAVQYGDGVFETIAIRDGRPRFWELHVERLALGCDRLGIRSPDTGDVGQYLHDALSDSDIDPTFATAKIIVTSGRGDRGYRRPPTVSPTIIVGVFASSPRPRDAYRTGIDVIICETRLAVQPQLAGIKSLNRLEQVLGQDEIVRRNVDEGLMLDTEGRLICGTMSNVFLIIDNTYVTPAITRCGVSGIMRRKVIEFLDAHGADYDVRDVSPGDVSAADGIFLSNSQFGVLPVRQCGDRSWPIADKVQHVMQGVAAAGVPECRP